MRSCLPLALRSVTKVEARVFCCPKEKSIIGSLGGGEGGGNPVSVFLCDTPHQPLPSHRRESLARTCEWESVFVCTRKGSPNELQRDNLSPAHRSVSLPPGEEKEGAGRGDAPPVFHFYLPSGEEVHFCAHAAIGACSVIVSDNNSLTKKTESGKQYPTEVTFFTVDGHQNYCTVRENVVELTMNCKHEEAEIEKTEVLSELMEEIGLNAEKDVLLSEDRAFQPPKFVNSSVARNKTLIPITSLARLHSAQNPKNPEKFRTLCDSIKSTGLYLYSRSVLVDEKESGDHGVDFIRGSKSGSLHDTNSYECRQFPRSSGYPEDPATGIAAAALALSLRRRFAMNLQSSRGNGFNLTASNSFDFFQGTAMGRRSKIGIRFVQSECGEKGSKEDKFGCKDTGVSILCSGVVEIFSKAEVTLTNNHSASE